MRVWVWVWVWVWACIRMLMRMRMWAMKHRSVEFVQPNAVIRRRRRAPRPTSAHRPCFCLRARPASTTSTSDILIQHPRIPRRPKPILKIESLRWWAKRVCQQSLGRDTRRVAVRRAHTRRRPKVAGEDECALFAGFGSGGGGRGRGGGGGETGEGERGCGKRVGGRWG